MAAKPLAIALASRASVDTVARNDRLAAPAVLLAVTVTVDSPSTRGATVTTAPATEAETESPEMSTVYTSAEPSKLPAASTFADSPPVVSATLGREPVVVGS